MANGFIRCYQEMLLQSRNSNKQFDMVTRGSNSDDQFEDLDNSAQSDVADLQSLIEQLGALFS